MDKTIRAYLAKIGARGGKLGGKARTPAKLRAGRRNAAKARKFLRSRKLCRVCKNNRLGHRNKSGVCRVCQRKGRGQVTGDRGQRKATINAER